MFNVGVKNVFISGLVYTTRVDVYLLERVHVLILDFCTKNCSFILITGISEVNLYIKMSFI